MKFVTKISHKLNIRSPSYSILIRLDFNTIQL